MYAGSFYPRSESALLKEIDSCFRHKFGPGEFDPAKALKPAPNPVLAVISPHAGYRFSGMAAAWSYKALAEADMPDLFIILAPNHRLSKSGISLETFQTPFGLVRVDQDFANALAEKGTILIDDDVHLPEHSLEVQLPFLQYVFKAKEDKIKIVPILVSSDIDLSKAALDIQETLMDTKKRVAFIVSSDFTHYGTDYGYLPFRADSKGSVKKKLSELDGKAIRTIIDGNPADFEEFIEETRDTICGSFPITLLLKTIKFSKAKLQQYYTSGDLLDDFSNSVSYASIVFYK